MNDITIGTKFNIDIRGILIESFDECDRGTRWFGETQLTHGKIIWSGTGNYPGDVLPRPYDYCWKDSNGGVVESEWGTLYLSVDNIDEEAGIIEGAQIGTYSMARVRLTFDEFERYASL